MDALRSCARQVRSGMLPVDLTPKREARAVNRADLPVIQHRPNLLLRVLSLCKAFCWTELEALQNYKTDDE